MKTDEAGKQVAVPAPDHGPASDSIRQAGQPAFERLMRLGFSHGKNCDNFERFCYWQIHPSTTIILS
jgi:hypothetical protein